MSYAQEKARQFVEEERAFRLGSLLTEAAHPKTLYLSQTAQSDVAAAIRMLQSVDEEIPPAAERVFAGEEFAALQDRLAAAIRNGRRIFFTGCGATGRLSILLEAAWRRFWRQFRMRHPQAAGRFAGMDEAVYSVMAGGDYALIKSVEGFEDFTDFGRRQLRQGGVRAGDVVVAITEGGETSFVIGTAWEGLAAGAHVFFVFNNPADLLTRSVERSRQVLEESRICKLDLATGPMAITGSTRMQATTIELLVVAAALEHALCCFLASQLGEGQAADSGWTPEQSTVYGRRFRELLTGLSTGRAVDAMTRTVRLEQQVYGTGGLVTYLADELLLDVLTDTTERSPTFMLPPFRPMDDVQSPRPWACVKNPRLDTRLAWFDLLGREPRGLDWKARVYAELGAPMPLQTHPPRLDAAEILKFRIGREPDESRFDRSACALIAVGTANESDVLADGLQCLKGPCQKRAALLLGDAAELHGADEVLAVPYAPPASPLRLWDHLAVKLVLNTISTATMAAMGRVVGNAMAWVSPSNKKLIDRGSRLISQLADCPYEQACHALFAAIESVEQTRRQGGEPASPVALAIERLGRTRP